MAVNVCVLGGDLLYKVRHTLYRVIDCVCHARPRNLALEQVNFTNKRGSRNVKSRQIHVCGIAAADILS